MSFFFSFLLKKNYHFGYGMSSTIDIVVFNYNSKGIKILSPMHG